MSSNHVISTERIKHIVSDSLHEDIDDSTSEAVAELMDRMLESIVDWSVRVAESRGATSLDVEDVRFIAEQEWGVSLKDSVVGFTSSNRK